MEENFNEILDFFKNNIIEILKAFILPTMILALHGLLSITNIYETIPWIDTPMHFFGGETIGISYMLLLLLLHKKGHRGNINNGLFIIAFAIGMVALTIVIWEFLEFSSDTIFGTNTQKSVMDTIKDLFLGLSGGTISCLITYYSTRK